MNDFNKHDLIQQVIVHANDLADARGVDKCVLIINIVQKLNTIQGLLRDEDANNEATIKGLTEQIDKLTAEAKEAQANADSNA